MPYDRSCYCDYVAICFGRSWRGVIEVLPRVEGYKRIDSYGENEMGIIVAFWRIQLKK